MIATIRSSRTTDSARKNLRRRFKLSEPQAQAVLDMPLKRLAGLIKHALNANTGRIKISTLAAATAQREATVQAGLAWLVGRGHLVVLDEDGDEVQLATGKQTADTDLSQVAAQLKALLEETAAYRAHFVRADKGILF